MKRSFKYILLPALSLLVGFSSCTKDDESGQQIELAAKAAYLNLSLSQSRLGETYATPVDGNATENEIKVSQVDVFIYKQSDGLLVKHATIDGSAFTYNTAETTKDSYTTTQKIETTTGAKQIVVGVNLPQSIITSIVSAGNIGGVSTALSVSLSDLTSSTSGIAMFSSGVTSASPVEDTADPANSVSVAVKRLVAKVAVREEASLGKSLAQGTLSDLRFGIRNGNTRLYPLQQTQAGVVTDPNWAAGSWAADQFTQAASGDYIAVNASSLAGSSLICHYAMENTSQQQTERETTYASVRAAFVPDAFSDGTGASKGSNTGSAPSTFWMVSLANGVSYYFNVETEADTFLAANSGSTKKLYTGGYCYYNLFLNPSNSYSTLRNEFYKVTITRILGLGNPSAEDNGDVVIAPTAQIEATIEILPWTTVDTDYQLIP